MSDTTTISSMTVDVFCERNSLGRTKFYQLLNTGRGPRLMDVGGMNCISVEAERDWRKQCEEVAATAPASKRIKAKL